MFLTVFTILVEKHHNLLLYGLYLIHITTNTIDEEQKGVVGMESKYVLRKTYFTSDKDNTALEMISIVKEPVEISVTEFEILFSGQKEDTLNNYPQSVRERLLVDDSESVDLEIELEEDTLQSLLENPEQIYAYEIPLH